MKLSDIFSIRTVGAALAVSAALNAAQFADRQIVGAQLEAKEAALTTKDTLIGVQNLAIQGMHREGERLEQAAEQAREDAIRAGAADRARADRYLSLPTPTTDQCAAARALVDEAIMEDRR